MCNGISRNVVATQQRFRPSPQAFDGQLHFQMQDFAPYPEGQLLFQMQDFAPYPEGQLLFQMHATSI